MEGTTRLGNKTVLEGMTEQAATPKRTRESNQAHNSTALRKPTRRSTGTRDTAQHTATWTKARQQAETQTTQRDNKTRDAAEHTTATNSTAQHSTAQHTKKRAKEDRTTRSSPQRHKAGHSRKTISREHGNGRQHRARHTYPGTERGSETKKTKWVWTETAQRQVLGHPKPETEESKSQRQQGHNAHKENKKEGGQKKTQRATPRAARAGKHKKPETVGAPQRGREGKNKKNKNRATTARLAPSKEERQKGQRKGEADQNAPARPARPTRPRRARTSTHVQEPGIASSDPRGEGLASTPKGCSAPAESPVEIRNVQEAGRVSDRVHTRQTTAAHAAQDRSRRDPLASAQSRGPEQVQHGASPACACLGRGRRQAT